MESEFQRTIEVAKIGDAQEHHVWKATPSECLLLEKRLALKKLKFFTTDCWITRLKDRRTIRVNGKIHASMIQECIVSLEDVPDVIQDEFIVYLRPFKPQAANPEEVLIEEEDIIEYKPMDEIDLGEVAVQYLSLALNPYPRADKTQE